MKFRFLLAVLCIAAAGSPTLDSPDGKLLRYGSSAPSVLERCTADLSRYRVTDARLPVVRVALPGAAGELLDTQVADNTSYYYRLKSEDGVAFEVVRIDTPNRPLPALSSPDILIDKLNYYVEVRESGRPVKRYPFTMGSRPGRKVCLDRASTPEGRYKISGLQWESNYYVAYDLNYPNAVDKARYGFFKRHGLLPEKNRAIGGAIQIHGQGDWYEWNWNLNSNWTWGCVAMRNSDLDELLVQEALGPGTPVVIVGSEITREDLEAIDRCDRAAVARALQKVFGPSARCEAEWLGRFQLKKGLTVTCQPDARTLRALGL